MDLSNNQDLELVLSSFTIDGRTVEYDQVGWRLELFVFATDKCIVSRAADGTLSYEGIESFAAVTPEHLRVRVFSSRHPFGSGKLKYRFTLYIPDEAYPDSVKMVSTHVGQTGIELTESLSVPAVPGEICISFEVPVLHESLKATEDAIAATVLARNAAELAVIKAALLEENVRDIKVNGIELEKDDNKKVDIKVPTLLKELAQDSTHRLVSDLEKSLWNALVSAVEKSVNAAGYNSNSKKIELKHDSAVIAEVDATEFIKDGMVSNVAIENGNIVITFNTDAGKEPVSIPLTGIFNPANYYDKIASDSKFATKTELSSVQSIAQNASANAAAANENLGSCATKDELNHHAGNSTVHVTAIERTRWNAKQNALPLEQGAANKEGSLKLTVANPSYVNTATAPYAIALGYDVQALAARAFAMGTGTKAKKLNAHAQGALTEADGVASHTEGRGTKAINDNEHAAGQYNDSHTGTISSIGIGSGDDDRKNAVEVMVDGRIYVNGVGGYDGTNPAAKDVKTVIDEMIPLYVRGDFQAEDGGKFHPTSGTPTLSEAIAAIKAGRLVLFEFAGKGLITSMIECADGSDSADPKIIIYYGGGKTIWQQN